MHHSFDVSEPPEAQQGHTFQTHSQGKQEPEVQRLTSVRTPERSLPTLAIPRASHYLSSSCLPLSPPKNRSVLTSKTLRLI